MARSASPRPRRAKRATRGDRIIEFIETFCYVPEGKFVGKPVKLRQWQKDIIHAIYDAKPTPRTAIVSIGRKNAKTTLCAFLLLAHLAGPEARQNAQIYSAAQSREQAAIVFKLAAKMVRLSPDLSGIIKVRDSAKSLFCTLTGVEYKALSAEHATAYGLSPVLVLHDELGQVRGPVSPLYDALETAMGAQEEPLSIVISTQAATDSDLLSTLIDDARTGADKRTVLVVFEAPKDAALDDEDAWRAANPALGDFLSLPEIRDMAAKAVRMPAFENTFRNLHLNQRVALTNAFISPDVWKLNEGEPDLTAFEDFPSWWGLDLSSRQDLTALIGVCPTPDGIVHVECHFFAPRDGIKDRAERDRAPYDLWATKDLLTATPGASVDYGFVAHRIGELMKRCPQMQAIAFDRWRIDVLQQELSRAGVEAPLVEWGQGFKDMSPALEALEASALAGKLRHGGHPVLTWNAANAVVVADPAGNRKLDKSKTTGRIDGLQALAMALGIRARGAVGELPLGPSPWETEGFRLEVI